MTLVRGMVRTHPGLLCAAGYRSSSAFPVLFMLKTHTPKLFVPVLPEWQCSALFASLRTFSSLQRCAPVSSRKASIRRWS